MVANMSMLERLSPIRLEAPPKVASFNTPLGVKTVFNGLPNAINCVRLGSVIP